MASYLKRIATGPKLSKDLSRGEARDGMALILDGAIDPVQAALFLIALRMKRESDDENFGILEALRSSTHSAVANVDNLIDIADPYDGFLRHLPAGPFLPALLSACNLPAYSHGCRQMGPKFGLTHHQVLAAAGVAADLSPEAAAACIVDPKVGWAYVDQAACHPSLHKLAKLRRLMVKRPCLSTLEKLCGPVRGRTATHLVVGYVHIAYEELLPKAARQAGFSSAMVVRGIEGGVVPSLNAPSKMVAFKGAEADQLNRLAPHEIGIESSVRSTPLPSEMPPDSASDLNLLADAAAQAGLEALNGANGPMQDSLVLAAAAILHHVGRAESLQAAAAMVRNALSSGAARERFHSFPKVNNL